MTRLFALLLLVSTATAADFTVTGTVHKVPVDGLVVLREADQTWTAEFWDKKERKAVKLYIAVAGTYLRDLDGRLLLTTSYANARILLKPKGHGYTLESSSADITMEELTPR